MKKPPVSFDTSHRGEQIYAEHIAPLLAGADPMDYVMIDVVSGDYEVGRDELDTSDRLRARRPDAQVWCRRIGSVVTRRYGRRVHLTAK